MGAVGTAGAFCNTKKRLLRFGRRNKKKFFSLFCVTKGALRSLGFTAEQGAFLPDAAQQFSLILFIKLYLVKFSLYLRFKKKV
jgi:hypothetical protein